MDLIRKVSLTLRVGMPDVSARHVGTNNNGYAWALYSNPRAASAQPLPSISS